MVDSAGGPAVVVVGAGQAGHQLALSLREEGWPDRVVLIGEEPHPPYQRPPISKSHATGDEAPEALRLGTDELYADNAIELVTGCRVTRIDRERRRAETDDGRAFPYDHLVLATGARNRRLPDTGGQAANVLSLRGMADLAALRRRMSATRRIVVVGGGFLGLEFAAAAAATGRDVTVVEAAPTLLSRVLRPRLADALLAGHRGNGIHVRTGARIAGLATGDGIATGVTLEGGETLPADLVMVGIGVEANDALARAAGLATADGIVVDERLLTKDPAISAIGDCARFATANGSGLRLESVQNAVDQARYAAVRLVHGTERGYDAVPWFWSQQGAARIHIAGLTGACDHVVVRGADAKLSALCFGGGRFLGVEALNCFADYRAGRTILEKRGRLDVETAARPGFALKDYAASL